MKTVANIELTDPQRNLIAGLLDGKASKREITRKEVVELTEAFWETIVALAATPNVDEKATEDAQETFSEPGSTKVAGTPAKRALREPTPAQLRTVAELAAKHRAAGKSEDWITGWRRGAMQVITRP